MQKEAVVPYLGHHGAHLQLWTPSGRGCRMPQSTAWTCFSSQSWRRNLQIAASRSSTPRTRCWRWCCYLGRDPRSGKADDLEAAWPCSKGSNPIPPWFQSQPVTQLVNGDLCLSWATAAALLGQARRRRGSKRVDFRPPVPKEGTIWMDTMAIPADALS